MRARGATLAEHAVALCARIEADEKSLLVFGKESPVRTACVRLVENTSFQVFVFVVVMFNSAVLAMELPDRQTRREEAAFHCRRADRGRFKSCLSSSLPLKRSQR